MVKSRGFANSVKVCGKVTTFWQHLIELGGNYRKRERCRVCYKKTNHNHHPSFFLHVGIKVGNHWGRENVMDRLCWRTLTRLIFIKLIIDWFDNFRMILDTNIVTMFICLLIFLSVLQPDLSASPHTYKSEFSIPVISSL